MGDRVGGVAWKRDSVFGILSWKRRSVRAVRGRSGALGINTPLVSLGVFTAGSALAAVAGVIAAPFVQADPSMGTVILTDLFVVIVIGGFGSLLGALLASLMIGELQSFGILWFPEFALVFQFLLMAVVLIVRPQGLFGEKG